ncbi:N-formylglutamate deformylase [Colwellia chukchiensis]|uniref:N-formylglutamate deformylase n=1 Tax=Colwellia chukchiensis TaxID=641665 RepID=A0A1H7MNL4_9GAMM|nr:N-formylglutamate amidohydrolase [Colwellia chukchiensis]SEL12896.1 N-formylglutamate deformylase [Colwellia chukchiensis]
MKLPFTLLSPSQENCLPLVFDSPHSGINFPSDFKSEVPLSQLKSGWDAFIDDLWQDAVKVGGHLLHADFSRMYIDPNRAPNDIDPALLDAPWHECQPTKYSERGMGLIRRYALPNVAMYKEPLSRAQIEHRIKHYYQPYHQALSATLAKLHQDFGAVWHIDCHSMKSKGNGMNIDNGVARPDIILGDNLGQAAGAEFVQVVEDAFSKRGYNVVRNTPYKGGYLVTHYGNIKDNRHSMQIEINRALYMNEKAFTPNDNYHNFKQDISQVVKDIADYVSANV